MNVFSNKSPQIDCPGNLPDNIITNSRQNANNFDLYPVLFFEQLQKSCLLFFQIVDKTTKYEKKAPPDEERLSIQRCFSFKCRLNALLSFIFAIHLTALSIFHFRFALVLIASRSICFHNRVRFLWLWSCLLWSFVGFRRCRGRSFCLAARAGRCRCGCLMCHCALISCICLSRSALCCRRCLRCVGRYSSGTVTFDLRCLSTVAAIVKKFTTHFFIILIDNQIRGPAAARSRCLCLHFLIRLQGTILGINRRRRDQSRLSSQKTYGS